MIQDLYKTYFQKSKVFLYPLIGISRKAAYRPSNTYVAWDGRFKPEDCKLIAVYKVDDSDEWKQFHLNVLLKNRMFNSFYTSKDLTENIYVFDLFYHKADYKSILKGQYSKVQSHPRGLILNHFGHNTPEWAYVESFLIPKKHFKRYAEMLGVDEEDLQSVGELCSPPDLEKETLSLETVDYFGELVKEI